MKKFLRILSVIFVTSSLFSLAVVDRVVLADSNAETAVFRACKDSRTSQGKNSDVCKNVNANKSFELIGPDGIITRVAQIIVWLVGIVSVVMVVIGGFKYATSGGDATGVNNAKNTILYAVVGLVIAIFAQVIVSFVLSNL